MDTDFLQLPVQAIRRFDVVKLARDVRHYRVMNIRSTLVHKQSIRLELSTADGSATAVLVRHAGELLPVQPVRQLFARAA